MRLGYTNLGLLLATFLSVFHSSDAAAALTFTGGVSTTPAWGSATDTYFIQCTDGGTNECTTGKTWNDGTITLTCTDAAGTFTDAARNYNCAVSGITGCGEIEFDDTIRQLTFKIACANEVLTTGNVDDGEDFATLVFAPAFKCVWPGINANPTVNGVAAPIAAGVIDLPVLSSGTYDLVFASLDCVDGSANNFRYTNLKISFKTRFNLHYKVTKGGFVVFDSETDTLADFYLSNEAHEIKIYSEGYTVLSALGGYTLEAGDVVLSKAFTPVADETVTIAVGAVTSGIYENYAFNVVLKYGNVVVVPGFISSNIAAPEAFFACDHASAATAFGETILGAWYDFAISGTDLEISSKAATIAPPGAYVISIPGNTFECSGVKNAPIKTTVRIGYEFTATAYHKGALVANTDLPTGEKVTIRLAYAPPEASYLPALVAALEDLPNNAVAYTGPAADAYSVFVEGNTIYAEITTDAGAFNVDLVADKLCAGANLCNAEQSIAFADTAYTPNDCTTPAGTPVVTGADYICEDDVNVTNANYVSFQFDVVSCTPAGGEVLNNYVRAVTVNGESVTNAIVFVGQGSCPASTATIDLDISGLPDGLYTFKLGSDDGSVKTSKLRIDRTAPVVTNTHYSGPVVIAGQGFPAGQKIPAAMFADKFTTSSNLKVAFVDSNLTGLTLHSFDVEDNIWHKLTDATIVSTFGLVQYPVGTYSYTVKAKDEAGNIAEGTFKISVVAPTKCVLTVADDKKLQSRNTLISGSSVYTVSADFDVPVNGVKVSSLKCTVFGIPCGTTAKLSAASSSRRFTWTFDSAFTPAIADGDVLKFELSMTDISVASNNYPVIAPSPVFVQADKVAPALYVKFRSPYYAVKSVPYTLVLPKTIFYDAVSAPEKIKIVSSSKPLQLGLSFVSGLQGIAKISGIVPATVNGSDKILSYDLTAEDEALNRVTVVDAVSVTVKASVNPDAVTNNDKTVLKVTDVTSPIAVFPSFAQAIPAAVTKARVYLIYSQVAQEKVICPSGTADVRDAETNIHYCEITTPTTANIKGITYTHDDTLHVLPGARTVRVDLLNAANAVIASFSRTLQVAIPNKVPVVSHNTASCSAPTDFVWDESTPADIKAFCVITIADGDDTQFASAKVSIVDDASTGSCDKARDFLYLPGNYVPEPKVYGVWSSSHCTLSLRSMSSTNVISTADLKAALESVKYKNLDVVNPTPGFDCSVLSNDCKRTLSIVVEDNGSAGANAKSLSVEEKHTLVLTSALSDPVIDQRIAYSRNGFLSTNNLFAYTKVIDPEPAFKYQEVSTQSKFVVVITDASTHKIKFNVANDAALPAGVYANGAIVIPDYFSGRISSVTVNCGGAFLNSDLDNISAIDYDVSSLVGTPGEHSCTFDVESVSIPFFLDVRAAACPFDPVVEDATDPTVLYRNYPLAAATNVYPDLTACGFTTVPVRSDDSSKEINIFYAGKAVLDNVFEELQKLKVSTAAQITGLSSLRNAARGFFSIVIPRYSLFSRQSMDFEYTFADVSNLKLPSLPAGASSADLDIALKMSPAGTSFSSNVRVCIFVGDTDPAYTRVLAVTSQKDVSDESKGYKPYEILSNQSFNIATGELCGNTKHFSVFVPITFPVTTAPEVPKDHLMGGSCPNACSGQGTCRQEGQCVCFAGFEGYDCSMRVCPTAVSWGEDQSVMHSQSECAGRGLCDRSTGKCVCFDGYEGGACERIKCPNQCSNNGKCRLLSELPSVRTAEYNSWEIDRIQVCVCDGGWTGADCSQRICPFGDDPETVCAYNQRQVQKVTLEFESQLGTGSVYNDEFILGFNTLDGSTFWTPMISDFFTGNSDNVETALKSLPQYAVDDVTVSLETATATTVEYHVTMSGRTLSGNQNLFLCPTNANGSYGCVAPGCRPKFKQLYSMFFSADAEQLVSPNMILSAPHSGAIVKTTLQITSAGTYFFKETYVDADPKPELNTEETVLPPAALRKFIEGPYGLLLDLTEVDTSVDTHYAYEWTLPSCKVEVVQEADPDLEALECANRGICNRETGQCECFTGYAGYNCAQQTVYV